MTTTRLRIFGLRMRPIFVQIKLQILRTAEYGARRFQTKLMNVFTARCALSTNDIIGMSVPINQERNRNRNKHIVGLLDCRQDLLKSQWVQQDGATPHTATTAMRHLDKLFGGNGISKKSDFPWSPHSPEVIVGKLADF